MVMLCGVIGMLSAGLCSYNTSIEPPKIPPKMRCLKSRLKGLGSVSFDLCLPEVWQ